MPTWPLLASLACKVHQVNKPDCKWKSIVIVQVMQGESGESLYSSLTDAVKKTCKDF